MNNTTPPVPDHLVRHFAAQHAGHFTPWFKPATRPENLHPATGPVAAAIARCIAPRKPTFSTYQVELLVDDHIRESFIIQARNSSAAFGRAVNLRRAIAIREHKPDISIVPASIATTAAA